MSTSTLDDFMTATKKKGVHTEGHAEEEHGSTSTHDDDSHSESHEIKFDKPVEKAKHLFEEAEKESDTIEVAFSTAYDQVAKSLLMEGKKINYNRLKPKEKREEFADAVMERMQQNAEETYGSQKGDLYKKQVLQLYLSESGDQIRRAILARGAKYTKAAHDQLFGQLKDRVRDQLENTAVGEFKREDIDDIIRYAGVEGHVDRNLDLPEAQQLFRAKAKKQISEGFLEQQDWYKATPVTKEKQDYHTTSGTSGPHSKSYNLGGKKHSASNN